MAAQHPDASTTGGPSFLESYVPYVLRRADQTLSAPFYAHLDRSGVARSEWRVLAVLLEAGPMGVVDLAAAALSPQPTVTHAVRRLEARHLVRRDAGVHDKRQRIVTLTPAGTELTRALAEEATRLQHAALADAGPTGELVRRLNELTERVERHLDEDRARYAG